MHQNFGRQILSAGNGISVFLPERENGRKCDAVRHVDTVGNHQISKRKGNLFTMKRNPSKKTQLSLWQDYIYIYNTHWNIQHTWRILYHPECYKGKLQTGCTVRYLAMLITAAPAPQLVTGRCQLLYVSCVHSTLMCSDRCLTANQTVRKQRDNSCTSNISLQILISFFHS